MTLTLTLTLSPTLTPTLMLTETRTRHPVKHLCGRSLLLLLLEGGRLAGDAVHEGIVLGHVEGFGLDLQRQLPVAEQLALLHQLILGDLKEADLQRVGQGQRQDEISFEIRIGSYRSRLECSNSRTLSANPDSVHCSALREGCLQEDDCCTPRTSHKRAAHLVEDAQEPRGRGRERPDPPKRVPYGQRPSHLPAHMLVFSMTAAQSRQRRVCSNHGLLNPTDAVPRQIMAAS
jgi:hypothetical protein